MHQLKWFCVLAATWVLSDGKSQVGNKQESGVGIVSGIKELSTKGRVFYSYRGIPYAKPPLRELRFKDPVKAEGWEGVKDASHYPPPCLQPTNISTIWSTTNGVLGSEDCLYLNVHTPKPHSKKDKLAVMVFLHGGGYYSGASYRHQPHFLLNHKIVLVVVQYRLGVLGFLSTEDDVISGNFGLKDQTMALRWVQRNIAHFGGDPQRVTLFGVEAGAAAAHLHMLRTKNEGLFSRVILQSGSAICPWALGRAHKEVAKKTAYLMACPVDRGSHQLLTCLQKVDARKLTLSLSEHFVWKDRPRTIGPRIDGRYLPDSPEVLLLDARYKKVDIISGVTAHEGSLITADLLSDNFFLSNTLRNFSKCGVASLELREGDPSPVGLALTIFRKYVGDVIVDQEHAREIAEAYGDRLFNVCHDLASLYHMENLRRSHRRVFLYQFVHKGQNSFLDNYPHLPSSNGLISHGDDLQYLFPKAVAGNRQHYLGSPDDRAVSHLITSLWTNFANTGIPTPDDSLGFHWHAASEERMRHLSLSLYPHMMDDTKEEARDFWTSLPTKQNLELKVWRSGQRQRSQSTTVIFHPNYNQ